MRMNRSPPNRCQTSIARLQSERRHVETKLHPAELRPIPPFVGQYITHSSEEFVPGQEVRRGKADTKIVDPKVAINDGRGSRLRRRLGNLMEDLACALCVDGLSREITQRDNADQFLVAV
jgi:hypothetical protein